MKVKILEDGGIRHAGQHFESGDEVTVPDEVGAAWCGVGWAEDLAGNVETGERKTDVNVMLSVENGTLDHNAEDAG